MNHELTDEVTAARNHFLVDKAAALRDGAVDAGVAMSFDEALVHTATLRNAFGQPLVGTGENAGVNLAPGKFFRLTESLDAALSYGDPGSRMMSAALAVDLHTALPHSVAAGQKKPIIEGILHIDQASELSVPEQLAGRYFGELSIDERDLVAQAITKRTRHIERC